MAARLFGILLLDLQMEVSLSANLFQLANFDKPMTTPAAFDRCPIGQDSSAF
jgi:hypothetical protein